MEIRPASIDQIASGRRGRVCLITADAGGVARQLHEFDDRLVVQCHEDGEPPYYSIIERCRDGRESLVLTARDLDARMVQRIRELYTLAQDPRTSIANRLDAQDDQRLADVDQQMRDEILAGVDELYFHTQHTLLGMKPKIAVPASVERALGREA